jgi:hypothetical protein
MAARRRFRLAWIVAGAVFAVASLGWASVNALSLLAFDRQTFQEEFDARITATVMHLDIDNDGGAVRIIGTDDDEIRVDGKTVRGLSKPTHDERVVGDTLEVDADCTSITGLCSVDYVVEVPRHLEVRARASGGGIRIFGMTGSIDAESSGGGVHVEGGSGDLRLRSSGGGVSAVESESTTVDAQSSGGGVRLEFVDEPQSVIASSSGGGVTVVVPRTNTTYRIDASSSGGGTNVDQGTRNDNSLRSITVHSSGGSVNVRYPTSP